MKKTLKYIDEFRDIKEAQIIVEKIKQLNIDRPLKIMEICGTHTMAIARFGIKSLLPQNVTVVSGPGCPVCVTANEDIDFAIEISKQPNTIVTTFGDMFRVPGSHSSLHVEKGKRADIRIVTSTLDALQIAREHPDKEVVFVGIGFETTAPTIASSIMMAANEQIKNYSVISCCKILPPALDAIVSDCGFEINGFLCPGHVSAITGTKMYETYAKDRGIPCVIVGFEPVDILYGIYLLLKQIKNGIHEVNNEYRRVVKEEGNVVAQELIKEVFEVADTKWRGFGTIPQSGLKIKEKYAAYDTHKKFSNVTVPEVQEHPGCICGEILRGKKTAQDCKLFKKICTPTNPIGACMVSSEGNCAAQYKYGEE